MNKSMNGFTLAEVLITLGIIGVVAAMTLPTVINNAKERETVAKVKKFYSTMTQALLMAIGKHGYVDEWGFCEQTNAQCVAQFVNNIKSELRVLRDCADDTNCVAQTGYKYLNGNSFSSYYGKDAAYYKMILNDGSYLWIRHSNSTTCQNSDSGTNNVCGVIWYDLNGAKEPNQLGIDIFVFFILKNRIIPHTNNDCYAGGLGWGCSRYILRYDNMKYPQTKE